MYKQTIKIKPDTVRRMKMAKISFEIENKGLASKTIEVILK